MNKIKNKNPSYHDDLLESLQSDQETMGYLKAAAAESDMPQVFLLALRNVAEARGISKMARETHLNRENLYKMLSKDGNPELGSLYAILNALGLKLSVELKKTTSIKPRGSAARVRTNRRKIKLAYV